MSFVPAAQRQAQQLQPSDPARIVLEFLINNCVGESNARPTADVIAELARRGHNLSREHFQQSILNATRQSDVFIGSSTKGLFLIDSISDAEAMRDFYVNRMRAEQEHLNNLRRLAARTGWSI